MVNQLRGAVLAQYKSISCFAKAMEWDRKKASRIINRQQNPTVNDLERMTQCLNVSDAENFVHIFLPSISIMWKNDSEKGE